MNWFKKAQLQETLPYFQEFEEYGDYVPNEDNLNNILENQFGVTISSTIGQGDSGVAYLLSNGDVLKITTNSQEGRVASYFLQNPNPNVITYKSVWKEGNLYYIIMEKIDVLVEDDHSVIKEFKYIDTLMRKNNCYNPECSYSIIQQDTFIKPELKQMLLNYLSTLKTIPIKMYDFLNTNNIGIKNGNIVFFDIT